jgi:GTPase
MDQKRNKIVFDSADCRELIVATVGNVDSGKSTITGVLTKGILDDGNGKSRAGIFVHPHEKISGRTSDISWQYVKEANQITSFIDLAGHEAYLKTTVSGLTSAYPDLALVCISDKITRMTKEHMGLCVSLNIPMAVVFTKIDLVPKEITSGLVNNIKMMIKAVGKRLFQIKKMEDIKLINDIDGKSVDTKVNDTKVNDSKDAPQQSDTLQQLMVPFVLVSNKTGEGIDLIKELIHKHPKQKYKLPEGFIVENVYNVVGHGTVVCGVSGCDIKKGDQLYMGPFNKGSFIQVNVKSIHNDYRFEIDELKAGVRGCLCIKYKERLVGKMNLRKGMLLSKKIPDNIYKSFKANVKIFYHHATIKPGYNAIVNIGMIREPAIITGIYDKKDNKLEFVRSGDAVTVEMEFSKNLNFLQKDQFIVFRDGGVRGIGRII